MGNKQTYSELLKHPSWQKKRLEVFELAGFECVNCGDSDTTLHIHHSYYEKCLKPWEYPIESLYCLCKECHEYFNELNLLIKRAIGRIDLGELERVLGYLEGINVENYPMVEVEIDSFEKAIGVGDCLGLDVDFLIRQSKSKMTGYDLQNLKNKYPKVNKNGNQD